MGVRLVGEPLWHPKGLGGAILEPHGLIALDWPGVTPYSLQAKMEPWMLLFSLLRHSFGAWGWTTREQEVS